MTKLYNPDKPFKILSIDGGGIRGIYPAKFLTELEFLLDKSGKPTTNLNEYFDLICGTSTGGIIALGLALGMKSSEILKLYKDNAGSIFGNKRGKIRSFFLPMHDTEDLENLLIENYSKYSDDGDTRLGHAKTRVCIPVYNGGSGRVSILKTAHHDDLFRDYQYPAHDVALSTAAAPFYFKPHSFAYRKKGETNQNTVTNNYDGGMFANNPTLIGLLEAIETLNVPMEQLKILSIGTGRKTYKEESTDKGWGISYWAKPPNVNIMDLIFSAQSDDIANTIKYLNKGVGNGGKEKFYYQRVQFEFDDQNSIDLDETDSEKLNQLIEKANNDFQREGSEILREFCGEIITPYKPVYKL